MTKVLKSPKLGSTYSLKYGRALGRRKVIWMEEINKIKRESSQICFFYLITVFTYKSLEYNSSV